MSVLRADDIGYCDGFLPRDLLFRIVSLVQGRRPFLLEELYGSPSALIKV